MCPDESEKTTVIHGLEGTLETELKKAKEQGCYAIDAKAMFYEQANQQQKLWSF